jgi:hypothetical protein
MINRVISPSVILFALCLSVWLSLVACSSGGGSSDAKNVISGTVQSGDTPVAKTTVTLYSTADGKGQRALGTAVTDNVGAFTLKYNAPKSKDSVLYLTTRDGQLSSTRQVLPGQFVLAVVVGPSPYADAVTLNERTTVGSAFAMAQFIQGKEIDGESPGLQIASKMIRHLVDIETGEPGATLTNEANGTASLTPNIFNEMANLVASCATDADICRSMMNLALPLQGSKPGDTFRAVANMAATPWQDPEPLFNLVDSDFYQPDLSSTPPVAWTLALKFKGDPQPLAGPGNIAFDRNGQLWIANNYVTDETYILPDCAGDQLFEMDPTTGKVNTYTGGGIDGAGYGITIAPQTNDIWVGNFGFKGTTCLRNPASDSVSQFTPEGVALSPDASILPGGDKTGGGWTNGGIGWPQGTVSNRDGDIWITNCNGEVTPNGKIDVTIYHNGNPDDWFAITEDELEKPFDVAFDTQDIAWVSGTNSDNLFAFLADGSQINGSPFDLGPDAKPMGVASDSQGNVWVSLSGRIELPCPPPINKKLTGTAGIAMVNLQGIQVNTRADVLQNGDPVPGGLTIAWGIAVDGADNVWVGNFTTGGLSSFCGADPSACPVGHKTGDALSPDGTGYTSALLDRNTAVQVDSSGNVWLANNWKDIPLQTDPAGDSVVVYIGLATPVKTPLIGTPEQP